jgi:hypothetical protein
MTRIEEQMFGARLKGMEIGETTSRDFQQVIEQPEEWDRAMTVAVAGGSRLAGPTRKKTKSYAASE